MTVSRLVLVTGASRGLGKETCKQLAESGCEVILTARDEAKGKAAQAELIAETGSSLIHFAMLDVTSAESIQALTTWIEITFGRLDALINNAGILPDYGHDVLSIEPQLIRDIFETNALAPLMLSRALIPMLEKGKQTQIINVSSGWGQLDEMDGEGPAGYKISKTALNAVTKLLAGQLEKHGVSVYCLCPGWVQTDMGGPEALRTVPEGARGISQLALLAKEIPTGSFLRDLAVIPW